MRGDPRRERSLDVQPARTLQIMPDDVAFGLAAGGLLLGAILAKAEHAQAAEAMLSGAVDPPPAMPSPAAGAAPPQEPGAAAAADHAHDAQSAVPELLIHRSDTFGEHGSSAPAVRPAIQATDPHVGSGGATITDHSSSSLTASSGSPEASASHAAEGMSHVLQDIAAPAVAALPGIAAPIAELPGRVVADLADTVGAIDGVLQGVEEQVATTATAATSLLQDLPSTLLGASGVLASATGILADALGGPSHSGDGPAPHPVAAAAPEIVPTHAVEHAEIGHIVLGFLGQSYADGHDAHDIATHTIGSPFHGFV
jgi:hypothetical protein